MIKQAAALPYRLRSDGAFEILLVTSRGKGRWILPKGKIDQGRKPADTATAEAFEEAGAIGRIGPNPIAESMMTGWGPISVHTLLVEKVFAEWPEMKERQRRWVNINEASHFVRDKGLRALLDRVAQDGATAFPGFLNPVEYSGEDSENLVSSGAA